MGISPATQRNLATLKKDGVLFVGPNDGEMACGEFGPGRMAEPLEIVAAIEQALGAQATGPLAGFKALVTAGPTHEPLDPGALSRQPLLRQAGLCHRRGAGAGGRRDDAGLGAGRDSRRRTT